MSFAIDVVLNFLIDVFAQPVWMSLRVETGDARHGAIGHVRAALSPRFDSAPRSAHDASWHALTGGCAG